MQFSLFDVLLLIGITQGLVTSVLLLLSKKNKISNRFLALVLIAFCLLSFKILMITLKLWNNQFIAYLPIGVDLALAPLVYFYMHAAKHPNFKMKPKYLLHFVPFFLMQAYVIFIYLKVVGLVTFTTKKAMATTLYYGPIKSLEDDLTLFSVIVYLSIGFIQLQQYRRWLRENTSDTSYATFRWLKSIYILLCLTAVSMIINFILDHLFHINQTHFVQWQIHYLLITVVIYYLGFAGYKQPQYVVPDTTKLKLSISPSKEKLSADKQRDILAKIDEAFTQKKVFLDSKINLKDLAKTLEVDASDLSSVINQSYQKNFRNLVNEHRVEEVKQKLMGDQFDHLSILGIALECGFNSEASFYRIFKKATGMSPSQYRNQQATQ
mgnify:FL=1